VAQTAKLLATRWVKMDSQPVLDVWLVEWQTFSGKRGV
jgi:hypothetical protein